MAMDTAMDMAAMDMAAMAMDMAMDMADMADMAAATN